MIHHHHHHHYLQSRFANGEKAKNLQPRKPIPLYPLFFRISSLYPFHIKGNFSVLVLNSTLESPRRHSIIGKFLHFFQTEAKKQCLQIQQGMEDVINRYLLAHLNNPTSTLVLMNIPLLSYHFPIASLSDAMGYLLSMSLKPLSAKHQLSLQDWALPIVIL